MRDWPCGALDGDALPTPLISVDSTKSLHAHLDKGWLTVLLQPGNYSFDDLLGSRLVLDLQAASAANATICIVGNTSTGTGDDVVLSGSGRNPVVSIDLSSSQGTTAPWRPPVELRGLTITEGYKKAVYGGAAGGGGLSITSADVFLTRVTVSKNYVVGSADVSGGGGVFVSSSQNNYSHVYMRYCNVLGNTVSMYDKGSGAGLYIEQSMVTIEDVRRTTICPNPACRP
jgi:hypothetical protein